MLAKIEGFKQLCLSRKVGESIDCIEGDLRLRITIVGSQGRNIRLVIQAPEEIQIKRCELGQKPAKRPTLADRVQERKNHAAE